MWDSTERLSFGTILAYHNEDINLFSTSATYSAVQELLCHRNSHAMSDLQCQYIVLQSSSCKTNKHDTLKDEMFEIMFLLQSAERQGKPNVSWRPSKHKSSRKILKRYILILCVGLFKALNVLPYELEDSLRQGSIDGQMAFMKPVIISNSTKRTQAVCQVSVCQLDY